MGLIHQLITGGGGADAPDARFFQHFQMLWWNFLTWSKPGTPRRVVRTWFWIKSLKALDFFGLRNRGYWILTSNLSDLSGSVMDFTFFFFRETHVGRGCWGHHFMAHNWIHFGLDPTLQVKLQRWFSKEQTLGCWVKWHTFCFLSAFIAAKSWLISTPHCSYRQNRKTPVSDRHRFSETLRTLPIQCCFPSGYRICHALDQVRYIKTQNLPATIRTWIKSNSWRFRYQSSSVVIMYFNYFIRSINRLVSRKLHGGFLK